MKNMKTYTVVLLMINLLLNQNIFSQQAPVLRTNIGHFDAIKDFNINKEKNLLVSCGEDGLIILWDIESGKEIKSFSFEKTMISCVDINNSANNIVFGDFDKENTQKHSVKIIDTHTGKLLNEFKTKIGNLIFVKHINDNTLLVAGSYGINLIDKQTNEIIRKYSGFNNEIKNTAISKDNKTIVASSKNEVLIWNIEEVEPTKKINLNYEIRALAIDNKGSNIAVASYDASVHILNSFNGKEISNIQQFRYNVNTLVFTNNDKALAVAEEKHPDISIFDIQNNKRINTIENIHTGQIGKLVFDNNLLYSSGIWDRSIVSFDTKTNSIARNFSGISKTIYQVADLYNNKTYAVGFSKNKLFIAFMSKKIRNIISNQKEGAVSCVAISPDNKLLAYGTSTKKVIVLELSTAKIINKFTNHKSWIRTITFSNDSKLLAVGSFGEVKIWDIKNNSNLSTITKPIKIPYAINFDYTNKNIAIGGRNFAAVFDVNSGEKIKQFKIKNIAYSVAFSYNNNILAVGEGDETKEGDYKIYRFDLQTKKALKAFSAYSKKITALSFSKDDKLLLSAGNKKIKVWDLSNLKETLSINAHLRKINDVEFSVPNQDKIISTSDDGTIKIWDYKTGKLLLTQIGIKGTENWISFAPDGRFNGSEGALQYFYFVKDLKIIPADNLFEKFYTPDLVADNTNNSQSINSVSNLPEIKINEPAADIPVFRSGVETLLSTSKKTTEISADFIDMGGGIDEIRIYQNNKLIKSEKVNVNSKGEKITKKYNVRLRKGLNIFEIASFNKNRIKNSKHIGIEYTGNELDSANMYIFAIGVNNYKKPAYNLNYAVSDANSFAEELSVKSKKLFKQITLYKLFNSGVTKDSINAIIDSIKNNATENDVFVFYYAGHGSMSQDNNTEKSQFYLIPYDITNLYSNEMLKEKGISSEEIRNFAKSIPAQKQLYIFDACQSGGAVEYLASRGVETEKAIAQLAHSTGTYFLSASGSQQLAGEFEQLGHGVFTYAILQAINGKAFKNNKLTVKSLSWFVEEEVPELSKKYKGKEQYPVSYGFGQDFPLIVKD